MKAETAKQADENSSNEKRFDPADETSDPSDQLSRDEKFAEISKVVRNTRVSLDLKSEKLGYILEMLKELRQLSATIDEPMVAYLIEMAVLETNTAINVLDFDIDADKERRAL